MILISTSDCASIIDRSIRGDQEEWYNRVEIEGRNLLGHQVLAIAFLAVVTDSHTHRHHDNHTLRCHNPFCPLILALSVVLRFTTQQN